MNDYDKAVKYMKVDKMDKALIALNKAIEQEPSNPNYFSERGVVYYHLKNKMKSIADMDKAVELQPQYSYRYSSRAYIKDWLGDLEGAIADYEKAVELDPKDAIAQNNLGMLQEKMGYKQKAQHYYDQADTLAGVKKRRAEYQAEEVDIKVKRSESLSDEHEALNTEITRTPNTEEHKESSSKLIKGIFSDKSTFKEFLRFIKNGFKIKH